MKDATHFIEVYKSLYNVRLTHGPLQTIAYLKIFLDRTKKCKTLKTIAVWKICMK